MRKISLVLAAIFVMSPSGGALAKDETLDIEPVYQRTPVWCWVAVSEMILKHYDVPNMNPAGIYQCGLVGVMALHGMFPQQCNLACQMCTVPAGSPDRITQLLENYPEVLRRNGRSAADVDVTYTHDALSPDDLVAQIDGGHPVIAGITPSSPGVPVSTSAHVALIVGYRDDGNEVVVNDPFPYDEVGMPNPYTGLGGEEIENWQYAIGYDDLVDGLNWIETFTVTDGSESGYSRPDQDQDQDQAAFCPTLRDVVDQGAGFFEDNKGEETGDWGDGDKTFATAYAMEGGECSIDITPLDRDTSYEIDCVTVRSASGDAARREARRLSAAMADCLADLDPEGLDHDDRPRKDYAKFWADGDYYDFRDGDSSFDSRTSLHYSKTRKNYSVHLSIGATLPD